MKYGFIKTAAATCDIRVADPMHNSKNIIEKMNEAAKSGAKLIVFPELCITGYTCADLFFQKTLIDAATVALNEIIKSSSKFDMLCVAGLPMVHNTKLYNCAAVILGGKLLGIIPKTTIPNHEGRYFCATSVDNDEIDINGKKYPFGTKLIFACKNLPQLKVGVELCEDLCALVPPSVRHAGAGATIILNASASDELVSKSEYSHMLISAHSSRLKCGYVCANAGCGESTTDLVFSGHNMIYEDGKLLSENKPFENKIVYSEIDVLKLDDERRKKTTFEMSCDGYEYIEFELKNVTTKLSRNVEKRPFVPENESKRAKRCEMVLEIQSMGLKKRLEHSGAKSAVIGISGGLDSSLALLVAHKTMKILERPYTDITAVTMPCFGTTKRTRSNAEILCDALGVKLQTIDIAESVKQHFKDIGHREDNYNVVYENAQARERTQILMDIANRDNGLVIGTGDLSELALGWATYNGDHMSNYSVNASVPKTLVRHIVRYCADTTDNEKLKSVLYDILDTPVSPELLPVSEEGNIAQKTEDIVGPYDLHDFFLYYMVRYGFSPSKIYKLCTYAFDGEYSSDEILYWMKNFYRRFFNQQFKRSCLPDGPKVGAVTLSPRGDWRMPSDATSRLWLYEIEKL